MGIISRKYTCETRRCKRVSQPDASSSTAPRHPPAAAPPGRCNRGRELWYARGMAAKKKQQKASATKASKKASKKAGAKAGASPRSASTATPAPPSAPARAPAGAGRGPTVRRSGLKEHCRSLAGTSEDIKWGHDLVFSIGGKMYAAFDIDNESELGFKCDDADFDRLTEEIPGIIPAPYAARFGWVKVLGEAKISNTDLKALLTKAHREVASCLSAKKQRELGVG